MKTIDKIIKDNWFNRNELIICKQNWICNWCWWKGWFNFTKALNKLPYFQSDKEKQLLFDLELICNMHDIWFNKWWTFLDFIKYNFKIADNIIILLHWTNSLYRIFIFISVFLWTTLFGWKYFNKK